MLRPLTELINQEDPAWPLVKDWMSQASNKVEVLRIADQKVADEALFLSQVTTSSPMGALLYQTGGLLIDNGWIRILGGGSAELQRTLPSWNKGKTYTNSTREAGYLLVADDVLGGLFAINGGLLGKDVGKMYYFAPETLAFEALEISYSQFLSFCFNGDLDDFYGPMRWKTWVGDMQQLTPDQAFSFMPFLWTAEAKNLDNYTWKVVPVEELYQVQQEFCQQLG